MENQENNQPEEEIQNIEQFQIGRSNGNTPEGHAAPEPDEDEYTADEVPFADGEGTQLNEEIEGPGDDEEDEDEETDDYNESDIEELDKDPNAYDEEDSEML